MIGPDDIRTMAREVYRIPEPDPAVERPVSAVEEAVLEAFAVPADRTED